MISAEAIAPRGAIPVSYIYAENWPAEERVATTGLDRALVPIIQALEPWHPKVLLAPRRTRGTYAPLHPLVRPHAYLPPKLAILGDEVRERLGFDYDGHSARNLALERRIPKGRGVLLSVLGGDARGYLRAAALARKCRLDHAIYCVDDPFAWANERSDILPKLQGLLPYVEREMRDAKILFAITPALAASLSQILGRACHSLPLPYSDAAVAPEVRRRQLIYVGNMSHLYADSFSQVVDAVARRRAAGDDITIRATVSEGSLDEFLSPVPPFVVCGRVADRGAMLQEVAESLAAICPISFDPQQQMVRTSFPSKLLDYLAQAQCIVVHAPADSVAAEYVSGNGLQFLTSDFASLEAALEIVSSQSPDYRHIYRSTLHKLHGPEGFRAVVSAAFANAADLST